MMNIFEKTYAQVQEANRVYEAATTEADKERARAIYHEATDAIEALGGIACRVWREYEVSRDSGNTYLDINDVVWDKDVEGLISCMRDNGIDHFTFSSGWSSAVETAWLFQKDGCRLEGLIEINSRHKDLFTGEQEKAHAYLFSIQQAAHPPAKPTEPIGSFGRMCTVFRADICQIYSSRLTCYYVLLERICVHRKGKHNKRRNLP